MASQSDASLGLIGIGLVVLVSGVLFRLGRLRYQASQYWRPGWPMVLRNGPFAQIPVGLATLLAGVAMRLDAGSIATIAVFVSALTVFLTGLIWVVVPPAYAKPRWIRLREREFGRSPLPSTIEIVFWWLLVGLIGAAVLLVATAVIFAIRG